MHIMINEYHNPTTKGQIILEAIFLSKSKRKCFKDICPKYVASKIGQIKQIIALYYIKKQIPPNE